MSDGTSASGAPKRLTLGAFVPGFEIYLRHFVSYSLVFLLAELPFIALFLANPRDNPGFGLREGLPDLFRAVFVTMTPGTWATFASTALESVGTAVVLLSVFHALDGTPISSWTSARRGLRRIVPTLATGFLVAAMFIYGLALLFVPALFVLAYMCLAVPACVVERRGPLRSLGRSGDLTGGSLGTMMVFALLVFVLPRVAEILVGNALVGTPTAAFGAILAIRVVFGALGATFIAVAYRELRRIKEHTDVGALIEAFE